MNADEVRDRVLKLEFVTDQHNKDCDELQQENKLVQERLDLITRTIFQVKWIALGSLGTAILTQIGMVEFVKGMF